MRKLRFVTWHLDYYYYQCVNQMWIVQSTIHVLDEYLSQHIRKVPLLFSGSLSSGCFSLFDYTLDRAYIKYSAIHTFIRFVLRLVCHSQQRLKQLHFI
jgi:hypothetical protein